MVEPKTPKAPFCTWLSVFFAMPLFLFSCGSPEQNTTSPNRDDSSVYYPINSYIRQQVTDIDTTPYFLYRITIDNGVKDSAIINRPTFDEEIKTFLLSELEETKLRANFTESVFEDAGTGSITLNYTPVNKDNRVQNVSVLLDRETQDVKWIFINTLESNRDSTILTRIGWKGGQRAFMNTDISYPGENEHTKQVSYVWNNRPE